jgi:hypothetical protein
VGQFAPDQPFGRGSNDLARSGVVFSQEALGQVVGEDGAFGRGDHALWQCGDVAGEAVDDVVELVGGDGSVDPAVAFGGLGVVQVGAELGTFDVRIRREGFASDANPW